ncbi:MAG: chemotaxis protein CheB, partial [Cyanobacteria bacterium J06600_6]
MVANLKNHNPKIIQIVQKPNRVIAIASSLGGIQTLITVISALPPDLPAAILLVQHLSPHCESHLTEILTRYTDLEVREAEEGTILKARTIYVTPPDKHLIVNETQTLSLSSAPKAHFVRPSAEYTFKSLANNYGEKAIAIVLTGCDGDGKEGVKVISQMGGKVIAIGDKLRRYIVCQAGNGDKSREGLAL